MIHHTAGHDGLPAAESGDDAASIAAAAETRFGGLSDEEWDLLAGGHFYSTSAWLRFCSAEACVPGDAAVSAAGGTTWAVPWREASELPSWSQYRWNEHLSEFELPLLAPGGILVGPSEGFQTNLLSSKRFGSPQGLAEVVSTLRGYCAERGREPRSCVAMYLSSADVVALQRTGVTAAPVLLDADAWIPIGGDGWDGWPDRLSGRRRKVIHREEREFAAAGYVIVHTTLASCCEQLGVPAAATLSKYGYETTAATELISLRRIVRCLGDMARVALCCRSDGDLVGFVIYYQWGDTTFLRWAGFNYDKLVGAFEYANLCYYTHMKRAAANGTRWLHPGGGAAHATKVLKGAELRPLWLMDLTENTPLSDQAAVDAHNRRLFNQHYSNPITRRALVDDPMWTRYGSR